LLFSNFRFGAAQQKAAAEEPPRSARSTAKKKTGLIEIDLGDGDQSVDQVLITGSL
jgi:hypothetical protein